ncbi:hypothetical protein HPB50_017323 [Hyalomma asiaticum]|uniref:Uncharacterized protein n=1 Tax=Hyalomma asiaticum TaxID=266040 RepID=A0ACB7RV11_HYAAI|nr:hypothetical protein HPB50_017323 [Hyalomma asiaticum]
MLNALPADSIRRDMGVLSSISFLWATRQKAIKMARVPLEQRQKIIELSIAGYSRRHIASIMKRPLKTVNRIVQAFKKERRVKDAQHRRRPRATTADEDRALIAAVVVRPQTTVREALRELGIKACETTAKRRLAEAALRKRVACRKPLIRKTNQTKQLEFARDHEIWTTSDWENVVFTDESSCTTRWDQRQRVWRPENSRYRPEYLQRVAASGLSAVCVWGLVTKEGLGPLVRIEDRYTSEGYCAILDDVMVPYLLNGPFREGDYVLQQDNSPVHTSRRVTRFFEDRGINTLSWPPQSPDLNIIENVWGLLKTALARWSLHGLSADDLWGAIKEEWERLRSDSSLTAALYNSLPSRMAAVVAANGDATRY